MTESSARSNIMSPFKKIGILDAEGRPTDLAYNWRDDPKYPEVCSTIMEVTYPQEVRDLYHDKGQDLSGLVSWFMSYCRCGEAAAKMYASFYRLLLKADPNDQNEFQGQSSPQQPRQSKGNGKQAKANSRPDRAARGAVSTLSDGASTSERGQHAGINFSAFPQLHVNIQLHISADTTAEQIDRIFESMAKHLRSLTAKEA
jgi:hypothetical protein